MLTQEQIDRYHADGYIAVENVLSDDLVAELRRVTDDFVERSRAVTDHTDVFDLEPGHTPEAPRLRRLKGPIDQHPVYDRALRDDGVLDIVAQLIGHGIRTNGNKLNMKSPGYGSAVEWHQDWAFYPHSNDDVLAVGVAMDDMTEENGCMLMIPGSHRGPIYSHHQDGHFVGAVTEEVEGADRGGPPRGGGRRHHPASRPHPARLGAEHLEPPATPAAVPVLRRGRLAARGAARLGGVQRRHRPRRAHRPAAPRRGAGAGAVAGGGAGRLDLREPDDTSGQGVGRLRAIVMTGGHA